LRTFLVEQKCKMRFGRFAFGVCASIYGIYVVSGLISNIQEERGQDIIEPILDSDFYDFKNDSWRKLSLLPRQGGRSNPSIILLND